MLSVKSQFSGTWVNLSYGLSVCPSVSDQRALLIPQHGPAEWPHLSIINRWSSQSPPASFGCERITDVSFPGARGVKDQGNACFHVILASNGDKT